MTSDSRPEEDPGGPIIRDRRRIDPQTGQVRQPAEAADAGDAAPIDGTVIDTDPVAAAQHQELEELVAERTADLQRLQAEYANYKKRVDRDRDVAAQSGIESVLIDLMPIIDSIEAARQHGELDGGFKLVADEIERLVAKHGVEIFTEVGDEFDPMIHEALMQMPHTGGSVEVPTVSAVMQKGVRRGERILRPARVGVAQPSTEEE